MSHETRSQREPHAPNRRPRNEPSDRWTCRHAGSARRSNRWLEAAALLVLLSWARQAEATVRPDPLTPEPGCERWVGKAGGNDPSVEIDLVICPAGGGVAGQLQWSSLQSGWNRRGIEGRWREDGAVLELRDVKILEEKPNPGWMFCTIDQYELTRRGTDRLEGHYVSKRCSDRATVSLTLASDAARPEPTAADPRTVPSAAASESARPRPTRPEPSASGSADADAPEPDAPRATCGCTLVGREAPRGLPVAWLAVALGAVAAHRRRTCHR